MKDKQGIAVWEGTRDEQPRRVAFVTNFIPHYRVPLYRKLATTPLMALLLVHGNAEDAAGRPGVNQELVCDVATRQVVNKRYRVGPFCLRWQSKAIQAVRTFRPDVMVVSGIAGALSTWVLLLWARLRRIDTVMWTCGWESQNRDTFAYACKCVLMRIFYRLPRRILVYSSTAKAYMCELGVPENRCFICYNGLDIHEDAQRTRQIEQSAARLRKQHQNTAQPIFLYVGGLLAEKRVEILLRAFATLRDAAAATLWLVGDGPAMQALRAEADALQVPDVVFWGRIVEEVEPFFAAADFFVLPGIGGLALNQAMFRSTPCICSTADGTERDLVLDGKTGFSFAAGDETSLLQAMRRAIALRQDESAYRAMAANARNVILEQSNIDGMITTFRKALRL